MILLKNIFGGGGISYTTPSPGHLYANLIWSEPALLINNIMYEYVQTKLLPTLFFQLVWGPSREIGCGYKLCPNVSDWNGKVKLNNAHFFGCNYGPA